MSFSTGWSFYAKEQAPVLLVCALGLLTFTTDSGNCATYAVTNINDSGAGSLRQAILDANANAGADVIEFNIPGAGPHTIQPVTELPFLADAVTIDGYTQPGASPNTLAHGNNAVLKIELDGSQVTTTNAPGLYIASGFCTIRGLVINRFTNGTGHAVFIQWDPLESTCRHASLSIL